LDCIVDSAVTYAIQSAP